MNGSIRRTARSPLLTAILLPLAMGLGCGGAGGGDVKPGVGAAGVALQDERAKAEEVLGAPEQTEGTTPSSPATREAVYLLYPSKGIDLLVENGKVQSIFLYQEGVEGHQKYAGSTPEGISLDSKRDDVLSELGEPTSRGLAEAVDLWFRYDSGVEFGFKDDGSIRYIVICPAH